MHSTRERERKKEMKTETKNCGPFLDTVQTYGQYSIKYIFGGSKRVQLQHQALLTSIETIF